MIDYDIAIIGGGPAGFFAAIGAAEANPDLRILIIEKGEQPLRKVRISGGGRCNVTHACYDPAVLITHYPRGGRELRGPFSRFQPRDTVEWFEKRGVALKAESDGRIFPVTNRSETVVDCLLRQAEIYGVQVHSLSRVDSVGRLGAGYVVEGAGFSPLRASKVLFAAGGGSKSAYEIVKGLGHTIVPPVPSIFTFKIQDDRLEGLAGISVPMAQVALDVGKNASQKKMKSISASGPLLITHWGLSGPAVLRISAWGARALAAAGYRATLQVNWVAPRSTEAIQSQLRNTKERQMRTSIGKRSPIEEVPTRLWQRLTASVGIPSDKPWAEVSNKQLRMLGEELTHGNFQITGKGAFKEEFVTCGGVRLKEVDFKTMESRISPGLFFAGEFLDVDGVTGGFNFQAAWTTGWLAGQAMAAIGEPVT